MSKDLCEPVYTRFKDLRCVIWTQACEDGIEGIIVGIAQELGDNFYILRLDNGDLHFVAVAVVMEILVKTGNAAQRPRICNQ